MRFTFIQPTNGCFHGQDNTKERKSNNQIFTVIASMNNYLGFLCREMPNRGHVTKTHITWFTVLGSVQ